VRHKDVLLFSQLAYRDLLGLPYVPKKFKTAYLPKIIGWLDSLPLKERGIPLASPVSAVLAPLLLLPLWFKLRRVFDVQLLVYADDLLLFCKSPEVCAKLFAWLHNRLLEDYGLQLQAEKTQSGRFSESEVDYCGWNFKGGYSRISSAKFEAFKQRLSKEIDRCASDPLPVFIKRVNRKIDGFGHYYKYGNVSKQFLTLDVYIRILVRKTVHKRYSKSRYNNNALQQLGLRTLENIYLRTNRAVAKPVIARYPGAGRKNEPVVTDERDLLLHRQLELLELIHALMQQQIRLQREQNRLLEQIVL
jgi:hypothetical protein